VDREIVLGVLILLLCGPMLLLAGAVPLTVGVAKSGRQLESNAWTRLWVPLVPSALAFLVLLGWALQEPDVSDERILPFAFVVALPFGAVVLRALIRAVLAQRRIPGHPIAATVGLLRPRVVISRQLAEALDADALAAAHEHEAAHARHHDPLRLALAQLVTDLQWPSPAARGRFHEWRHALELARDEEVRVHGVEGADLAAAVLAAARLQVRPARSGLVGDSEALEERIARLLVPIPAETPVRQRATSLLVLSVALAGAFTAGLRRGDVVVRSLPGVRSLAIEKAPTTLRIVD